MKFEYVSRWARYVAERLSRSFAGKRTRPDVFISAVTSDLGTVRKLVRDALLDSDCFPVEQSHFAPDYRKLEDMLRTKIRRCQAMIHVVGMRYGFEPNPASRPPDTPRRSYTQMEYYIAQELGLPCYVFICPEDFPYDQGGNPESEELQQLQRKYRAQFFQSDFIFTEFNDRFQLEKGVLRLQNALFELRASIDKNTIRQWWLVLLNWLILILIAGGLLLAVRKVGTSADSIVAELRRSDASDRLHTQATADSIISELRKGEAPDRLRAQAAALFDGGNYAEAFHVYARLSDADPGNVELHRRVQECARRGKLGRAFLDRYSELIQLHPTNAIYCNYLGNAYLMLDPRDTDGKALARYEAAVCMDTNLVLPFANLGILAFRAGQTNRAEALFQRYITAYPDDSAGWVNLGLLYIAKVQAASDDVHSVTEAEKVLHAALRLEPASALAYKALGRLLSATGRKNEALNAFQRSLMLNYEQPDVRQQVELLAWDSSGTRLPGIGTDDFSTRAFPNEGAEVANVPAAVAVMRLLDESLFKQAASVCNTWVTQEPGNPLAQYLLGRAYQGQGLQTESQKAFAEAERLAQLVSD